MNDNEVQGAFHTEEVALVSQSAHFHRMVEDVPDAE
jgi:hypothetical protein